MELILNDYSIAGQFETLDSFETYFINQLDPAMQIVIERKIPFYKRMDTFSRLLTDNISVNDYIRAVNNPVATRIKVNLIQMAYAEPYWDEKEQLQSDENVDYRYPGEYEEPNCFTEVIERNESIFSFPYDKYMEKEIQCFRNNEERRIVNVHSKAELFFTYLKDDKTNLKYVFENYPFERHIKFACVNEKCHTEEALLSPEILMCDIEKIFMNIPKLIEDKSAGKKTHWWDSIENDIFEYRVSISSNREFRIFFLWRNEIIFLNGFIKKTMSTPENEKKKARAIIKNMKN